MHDVLIRLRMVRMPSVLSSMIIHVYSVRLSIFTSYFDRMDLNVAVASREKFRINCREVATDRFVNIVLISPELNLLMNYPDLICEDPVIGAVVGRCWVLIARVCLHECTAPHHSTTAPPHHPSLQLLHRTTAPFFPAYQPARAVPLS